MLSIYSKTGLLTTSTNTTTGAYRFVFLCSVCRRAGFELTDRMVCVWLLVDTSKYSAVGCWSDSATTKALTGSLASVGTMTQEACVSSCASGGYVYAGLEAGFTCYCGNALASSSVVMSDSSCATACKDASLFGFWVI